MGYANRQNGGHMDDLHLHCGPTRTVAFTLPAALAARLSGKGRLRSDRCRRLCAAYVLEAQRGDDRFLREAEALAREREPETGLSRVSVKMHEGLCARIEALRSDPSLPLASLVRAMVLLAWFYMGDELWP